MSRRMHLHDLPEELLRSVFLKLPISSVLVARAVCKSWKLFLSSSSFLIEHDATSPRESWIISRHQNRRDLTLLKTTSTTNKLVQLEEPSGEWYLADASEGLLCFLSPVTEDIKGVLVYNPVTRASREVKGPPPLKRREFWKFACSKETGEWKIVILDRQDSEGQLVTRAHVFSSRTGEWKLGCKPVREQHDYVPLTQGTSNPLPAYDWNGNVIVTYDMDTDSWTELEGTPPLMEGDGDWAIYHCMGHGTFIVNNMEEAEAEAERVGVFRHISDKKKWELVSQSPLLVDPGFAIHISDGQDNIWIQFSLKQLLVNYNVASNRWRFFPGFSPGPLTCCTFSFRKP